MFFRLVIAIGGVSSRPGAVGSEKIRREFRRNSDLRPVCCVVNAFLFFFCVVLPQYARNARERGEGVVRLLRSGI